MAQRLKTVEYAFPILNSLVNNTLTNLSQITLYLPESNKSFKSVELRITCDDIITATGGSLTTKTINLRLGSADYLSTTNAGTLTHSGENISHLFVRDFTSHFNTNWSGTSMTCDAQIIINQSTGTTLGMVNVCARLYISYEYDDTSTTHIKTVYIPLNAPVTNLETTRPASFDTIPALDTYLPEVGKNIRDYFIWFGANTSLATTNTVDHNLSFQIDSDTEEVSGNYEAALATDRWTEYIFKPTFTTNTTHEIRVWTSTGGVSRHACPQLYLVVTYEFNPTDTTIVMNSLLLPMDWESPAGVSSTIFQRAERELMIQEPGTITLQKLALFTNYATPISPAGNYRFRIGTGSWITLTYSGSGVSAGQRGHMLRNDEAFSLSRGRNILQADCYSGSATATPTNISSFWVVNYTSGKASAGVGAHNHTVFQNILTHGTGGAVLQMTTASVPFISIPETSFYIVGLGMVFEWMSNSTINPTGSIVQAERLVSEGGLKFESIYIDANSSDPEPGIFSNYSQARSLFQRWPNDADSRRIAVENSRRFKTALTNISMSDGCWHLRLASIVTYHSITYTVSGSISNSNNRKVYLYLHRESNGEILLTTSRTGDGSYSFTWYDNTENLYVEAYGDNSFKGRSAFGLAL